MNVTNQQRTNSMHHRRIISNLFVLGVWLIGACAAVGAQPRQPVRPPDRPAIDISSPPRITGFSATTLFAENQGDVYYGEVTDLLFRIENLLGRGVTKIEVVPSAFVSEERIQTPRTGPNVGLSIRGKFLERNPRCPENQCAVKLKLTLFYAGKTQIFEVDAGIVAVSPLQEYRIENTKDLAEILAFRPEGFPVGACSGRSDFPGQNSYPVGMLDGGQDISFRIRSGPLGTECYWRSSPLRLKTLWHLVSVDWQQEKAKTNCLVSNHRQTYITVPVNPNFVGTTRIIPDENAVYVGFGTVHASDPLWGGRDIAGTGQSPFQLIVTAVGPTGTAEYMRPMMIVLNCGVTALNDNGVQSTLKSVTLRGPPNKRWKDGVLAALIF